LFTTTRDTIAAAEQAADIGVGGWATGLELGRHQVCRMKTIVILLAVLAAAKIGHHEYLFRISTRDALISAYKGHAIDACQKDPASLTLGLGAQAWSAARSIQLVIGKSTLSVYPWQVDNAQWNARYRNPYLFLTASQRGGAFGCEYDIVNASAFVSRM
jgi:hypothetical protein